ncbi:MAG: hypothetical protein E6J41_16415 [Chloroflexi bacterium]|jgi:hypothetical protein|nr:MAG: hypothetical protein E6J41_16415 [Chloroflexota bacterium]
MIDEGGLQTMRAALEADGYLLDVSEAGERLEARISAGPGACEDCLVPKPVLLAMLHQALGVPEQAIDLRYPGEA